MSLKEYIDDKIKNEYGLPNSKQKMIDSLIEISENVMAESKNMSSPEQIFQMASEIKFRDDVDDLKKRIDEARLQVLDILKEKFSKTINNDKETSKKEKELTNERSKGKNQESTSR